jgi:hypothetical protein
MLGQGDNGLSADPIGSCGAIELVPIGDTVTRPVMRSRRTSCYENNLSAKIGDVCIRVVVELAHGRVALAWGS